MKLKKVLTLMGFGLLSFTLVQAQDASAIIKKASEAVGTSEAMNNLKDVYLAGKMSVMGQELDFIQKFILPTGFATEVNMGGMTAMKQVKNGDTYSVQMQGMDQEMNDEAKNEMNLKASFFEEKYMLGQSGYKFALKNKEMVDGKEANVVEITKPDGGTILNYYDVVTGLKVQDSREQEAGPMGKVSLTTKFMDYKEFNGIKVATKLQVAIGPMDQEINISEVKINSGLKATEL